jgi:hypothetical protein
VNEPIIYHWGGGEAVILFKSEHEGIFCLLNDGAMVFGGMLREHCQNLICLDSVQTSQCQTVGPTLSSWLRSTLFL